MQLLIMLPEEVDALAGPQDGACHLPADEGGSHVMIQAVPTAP